MAAFDLSVKIGATTYTLQGSASVAHLARFAAALRRRHPGASTDAQAVLAWLLDHRHEAKTITRDMERSAAIEANVDVIEEIEIA